MLLNVTDFHFPFFLKVSMLVNTETNGCNSAKCGACVLDHVSRNACVHCLFYLLLSLIVRPGLLMGAV